jgi:hypothetical protein
MFDSMVLIGEEMSLASVQFLLILSMCIAGDESPLSDQQCGGKALYVILQQYQIDVSADDVLRNLPQNGHNSSLEELAYLANKFGLSSIGRRWVDDPPHRSPPAIIPVRGLRNSRHFVAVLEWQGENAIVQDGDYVATIPLESIRKGGWDGRAAYRKVREGVGCYTCFLVESPQRSLVCEWNDCACQYSAVDDS